MLENTEFIRWFRTTAPYIHAHRGKTFVLQFGGSLIEAEGLPALVHDLALLNSLGIRLVVVFGVQPQLEALQRQRDIRSRFINHLRVIDAESIACMREAAGGCRIRLEALLSMGLPNSPMEDARISVTSGNFITAKPFGIVEGVDLAFAGEVRRVDVQAIQSKLNNNEIVLIPPLGYSLTGELFALLPAEIAMKVAISMHADKLLYLLAGKPLQNERGENIRQLTQQEAKKLLDEGGNLAEPPHLQLSCGVQACNEGVKRIHLVQQEPAGNLLLELFSRDGIGTLLSAKSFDQIRIASVDDIGGILQLIEPLEQAGILIRRSRERIEADIGNYTILARDGAIIGCAALHIGEDKNIAELACLAVHEDYQGSGRGEELFLSIEQQAIKKGVKKLFALTTQAEHWFLERGFLEADVKDLPAVKQTFYNYQRKAKVLVEDLT